MTNEAKSAEPQPRLEPVVALSWLAALLPGLYLLLTSTTSLISGIWPYDAKRLLQFGVLILLFLLPTMNRQIRKEFGQTLGMIPNWAGITLIAVFVAGVASASVNAGSAMHLANSLSEVALLACLVLGVFVVAACRHLGGQTFDRIAVSLIALTGLVVGVQELLGVMAAHVAGVEFNYRGSLLHFSWPRFYNQFQSWTVPVITALPLLFARYSLSRMLCLVVLALQWYIILMTGARGSFVALTAALLIAFVFLRPARSLLKWQLPGFILGCLIYAVILLSFEFAPSTVAPKPDSPGSSAVLESPEKRLYGSDGSDPGTYLDQSFGRPLLDPMGRTWMWKVTINDALHNPLLGIGPMNYVCISAAPMSHPHNFLLQLAAEWGIPVSLAVSLLCIVLLWRLARAIESSQTRNSESFQLLSLYLTGAIAAALHANVSGVMVMPASQVTGLLVCGCLIGTLPKKAGIMRLPRFEWLPILGLLLTLGISILGIHELRTMEKRSALLKSSEALRPRLWQDSKVCRQYVPRNKVTY